MGRRHWSVATPDYFPLLRLRHLRMRLIAWNCNERFNRNYLHLRDLDFDVAVVTECGPFEPEPEATRTVSSALKLAVDQPGHTKHIGVLAQDPWHVAPMPLVPDQPWLLPAKVTGPVDFTVLAVWALGPSWVKDRLSYAAQTARVVADVLPSIAGPVVLAGDLNAPISSTPADARRHANTVTQLAELGFVSAYTTSRGEIDPLTEPTLYHREARAAVSHRPRLCFEGLDNRHRGDGGDLRKLGRDQTVRPRADHRRHAIGGRADGDGSVLTGRLLLLAQSQVIPPPVGRAVVSGSADDRARGWAFRRRVVTGLV